MNLEAQSASFTIDKPDHWIVNSSIELDNTIYIRDIMRTHNKIMAVGVFPNFTNKKRLENYFENVVGCKIERTKKTPYAFLVNMESKPSRLDNAMSQIIDDTGGRVWMRSRPDRFVDVVVESPWGVNFEKTIASIMKKYRMKLSTDIEIKKETMQVPIPFDKTEELQITEKDRTIAQKLLVRGYFNTPRPKKAQHSRLAKELGISKPTFETHVKKIQEIGVKELLGIRSFTNQDLEDTWKFIESVNTKKAKKN